MRFLNAKNTRFAFVLAMVSIVVIAFAAPLFVSAQSSPPPPVSDSCSGTWFSWSTLSINCWIRSGVVIISGGLLYIASWVLYLAAALFNLLVESTIINFGGFLFSPSVRNAVEIAWTAFRDLANIVIIGMFVYYAISIILGVDSFGWRRRIPSVIIVAIFINFSLLFTYLVVDFSNFTALQFYRAAGLQSGSTSSASGSGATAATNNDTGIAAAYLALVGAGGIGDTVEAVKRTASDNDSGWQALLHGVAGSIFLVVAAIMFLYGSYLLISRALLLIFLMLTSAIAVATYLIPAKFAETYGFWTWLGSLLRAAVFAPLLMVMMWITLKMGQALQAGIATGGGTLGRLETSPTDTTNLYALLMYIIMIGLLFITFKIASSFSTSIGGFNWAAYVPGLIGRTGAKLAFGGAAMLGRNTLGWGAYAISKGLESQARNDSRGNISRQLFKFGADQFMKGAKSDMNILKSTAAKTLGGAMGMKNVDKLLGKGPGGYIGAVDKTANRLMSIMSTNEKEALKQQAKEEEKRAKEERRARMSPEAQKQEKDREAERAALKPVPEPKVPEPEEKGGGDKNAQQQEREKAASQQQTQQAQQAAAGATQKSTEAFTKQMREEAARQSTEATARDAAGAKAQEASREKDSKLMKSLSEEQRKELGKALAENPQQAQAVEEKEREVTLKEGELDKLEHEQRKMADSFSKEMKHLSQQKATIIGTSSTRALDDAHKVELKRINEDMERTHTKHKSDLTAMARQIEQAKKSAVDTERELTEMGKKIINEARARESARILADEKTRESAAKASTGASAPAASEKDPVATVAKLATNSTFTNVMANAFRKALGGSAKPPKDVYDAVMRKDAHARNIKQQREILEAAGIIDSAQQKSQYLEGLIKPDASGDTK